jgi:hypothetical protein
MLRAVVNKQSFFRFQVILAQHLLKKVDLRFALSNQMRIVGSLKKMFVIIKAKVCFEIFHDISIMDIIDITEQKSAVFIF